jgi:hypothetical protein
MPRAIPKTLASLIMHENSDPMFLRNDVTFCKLVSFWATCIVIIDRLKLVEKKVRKGWNNMSKYIICIHYTATSTYLLSIV